MTKIEIVDRWDDIFNDQYMSISIGEMERVDVKKVEDSNYIYVMDCSNGLNVYSDESDKGLRDLTKWEHEQIIQFAEREFKQEMQEYEE